MTAKKLLPAQTLERIAVAYQHLAERARSPEGNTRITSSLEDLLEVSGGERKLEAGEVLFLENDPGDSLYWIESGILAVLQGDLDDPRLLVFRHPGQIVGEIALLENIHRTATVAAVVPTRLKTLSKEKFQGVLAMIPGVGIELIRLLSARLREIQPAELSAGMYDHLTKAFSRQAFDNRIREEIERAQLYRYNFSLVFLDLDHFKEINDTYGHSRGDEVLTAFVQRTTSELRTTDLLFRYGGDEFVLLLQGIDSQRGPVLIERLIEEFQRAPIPGNPPLTLSFSAGIAYFPADGDTPLALLKAADERVYHSKRDGRGKVTGPLHPSQIE
ncbi:MAG: GGDEF domain-containing protein [Chloroflexota bacterium]